MDSRLRCPQCTHLVKTGAHFCNHCGYDLATPPPPPPQQQMGPPPGTPQYAAYPAPPPPRGKSLSPGCIAACIIGVLVVGFVCLFTVALPSFIKVKEKAKEAETKANLHSIQVDVEKYAVSRAGNYPAYLIGGDAHCAAGANSSGDPAFTAITACPAPDQLADPLLRAGYLPGGYPRNPFVRDGIAIHQVQEHLDSSEIYGVDPLRNATPDGALYGTRFGAECNVMGSVLADPRYRLALFYGEEPESATPSFADVEYEFWDMWQSNKPAPYLPGQFFYKSMGPIVAVGAEARESSNQELPFVPTETDQYILAAYGGVRTKGRDVLGAEQPFVMVRPDGTSTDTWMYTRSEVSPDPAKIEGSAYSFGISTSANTKTQYGNPNGLRDALVLVLTAGS
ncbi:zinc ribbon domain-containing protein [bacterium]|nr:zinc ribbon domain-containing protein [bacterium]